jgi:hypothetical protein
MLVFGIAIILAIIVTALVVLKDGYHRIPTRRR